MILYFFFKLPLSAVLAGALCGWPGVPGGGFWVSQFGLKNSAPVSRAGKHGPPPSLPHDKSTANSRREFC